MKRLLLFSLLTVGLSACGGSSGDSNAASEEPEPVNRFDTKTYAFTYQGTGALPNDRWRIGVELGEVVTVQYLGDDKPDVELQVDTAPSVYSLIQQVESCSVSDQCVIEKLTYDNTYYYPASYYGSTGEEGSGFEISDFLEGGEQNESLKLEVRNDFELQTYVYSYNETGFSPLNNKWRIEVVEGSVMFVEPLGTVEPRGDLTIENAPTISDLMSRIQNCAGSVDCEVVELDYDDSHHYPTVYYSSMGEEGSGFIISDFQEGQQVSDLVGWASYVFHYEENGNLAKPGKWEIQVEGDEVIYSGYVGENSAENKLSLEEAPTLKYLMQNIARCSESSQCVVRKLQYNENSMQIEGFSTAKGREKSEYTISGYAPL